MHWWVIELITNIVLVALAGRARAVHQAIRTLVRGRRLPGQPAHRQELPRADRRGVLPDLHVVRALHRDVRRAEDWIDSTGAQLKHEVARVGGILLIMGVLHAANVVALPIIGRLLSTTRRRRDTAGARRGSAPTISVPPLGPGTWMLRIEPAPGEPEPPTT